ncbi:MAG: outer membrane protein transport protein [Acinetobacter haemolyticus]
MSGSLKSKLIYIALLSPASLSHASGIFIDTQTAAGVGYAFAGSSALAQNASVVAYNPAAMMGLNSGHYVSGSVSYVEAKTDFKGENNSSISPIVPTGRVEASIDRKFTIPSAQYVYRSEQPFAVGMSVSPLYGNKGEWNEDFVGRYQGLKTDVTGVNVNTSLAYEINPQVMIGLGLNYLDFDATLTRKAAPLINTNPPAYLGDAQGELKGDGDGWAGNIGVFLRPTDNLDLGLTYRSETRLKLNGALTVTTPVATLNTPATVEVKMPQSASLAGAYRFTPQWTALAEFTWYDWSVLPEFSAIHPETNAVVYEEKLNFKDGLRSSIGALYQITPTTQLRFGMAYDKSVVESSSDRTVRFPDTDRIWLSFGAGFQVTQNLSMDVGYSHIFANEATIESPTVVAGNPTMQTLKGSFDTEGDIFSLQLNYKF